MSSDCEQMKDQIADHITGILSETQMQSLELHLNECKSCREYARALKKEDTLLTELFAEIETNMTNRQEQILRKVNQLCVSKQTESPSIRRIIMKSSITKLAAAAVIIIAVFIGIDQLGTNGSSVVWADVAEQFESVPFFNITAYIRKTGTETKKIEIWRSEDSRIRINEGNKVFFKDLSKYNNKFTIFDRSTKKPVNGDVNLPSFIRRLCGNEGRFSLDTLTKNFPSDVKGIIPLETADTTASNEIVLFGAKAKEIPPEALKIWTLRKSKLPIRFFVSPKEGYMDLFFDYSEQKDVAFFDPVAFTNQ